MSIWRWSSSASGDGHSRASVSRRVSCAGPLPRRDERPRVRVRAFAAGFFAVLLRVVLERGFLVVLIPRNFDARAP
jgi:hypothetical protein